MKLKKAGSNLPMDIHNKRMAIKFLKLKGKFWETLTVYVSKSDVV